MESIWTNIVVAIVSAIATWALGKLPENTMLYVKDFIITFSPVFVGLIVYFAYWMFRVFSSMSKTIKTTIPSLQRQIQVNTDGYTSLLAAINNHITDTNKHSDKHE